MFGQPSPAPGGFGGAPAPAFGAAPAPGGFGAAPAPAFGAAPAPAFGAAPGGFGAAPAPGGFGSTPAPAFGAAPAPGAFGSAPAPAFGAAPAPGGFGAPAPGAFGAAPAPFGQPAPAPGGFGTPAPSGGIFGAPAPGGFGAPAPSGGLFGAPASGGFGASAPSGGGLFGATAPAPFGTPAPAGGGLFGGGGFGSTPAAPGAGFGQQQQQQQLQQPAIPPGVLQGVTGKSLYSSLTPEQKQAIDKIHQAMMQHKQTMIRVQSMGPQALILDDKDESLPAKLKKLHNSLNQLQQNVVELEVAANAHREKDQTLIEQTYMYAKWPVEAIATRRGIRLATSSTEEKKETDGNTQARLRDILERQMAYVDRIERMPSPYMWQTLDSLAQRWQALYQNIANLHGELQNSQSLEESQVVNLRNIVDNQDQFLYSIRQDIHRLHRAMDKLRATYSANETGENVVEKAQLEAWEREKSIEEQIQMQLLRSASAPKTPKPSLAGAPTTSVLGGTTTPAFGGSTTTTPASTFGATATPAPAPTGGGIFGSSTTPAPAAFSGGFGAAKPSASSTTYSKGRSKSSRSSSRSRK